jgi:hypothetical protein
MLDNSNRRTRFETRVSIEREFLTPINAVFGSSAPLAGMTRDAIESWRRRADGVQPQATVNEVAQVLLEASARAELLADNSKDVFEPDRRPRPDSLVELRTLLDEILARIPRMIPYFAAQWS